MVAVDQELQEYIKHVGWIKLAYDNASNSPDPSTQVGALIVGRAGYPYPATFAYNDFPTGWKVTERDFERPRKYQLICHAERNAIFYAARNGLETWGTTLVGNWAACEECAKAIVQSGIQRLIRHKVADVAATPGWEDSVALGDEIMIASGLQIIDITGPIPGAPVVRRGGENFDPSL